MCQPPPPPTGKQKNLTTKECRGKCGGSDPLKITLLFHHALVDEICLAKFHHFSCMREVTCFVPFGPLPCVGHVRHDVQTSLVFQVLVRQT